VLDGAIEHVERHHRRGRVFRLAAAVDQDVETAREFHRAPDQPFDIGRILDVRDQRHRAPADCLDQRHRLAQRAGVLAGRVQAARAHHHRGALGRQPLRQCSADAATGAGDECDFSVEQFAHFPFPPKV